MSTSSNKQQKKGKDGMGNAGKRKEMVKDRRVQAGRKQCVSKLCVRILCVSKLCVRKLCGDKLCVRCVSVWTMSNKCCSGTGKEGKIKEVVKHREVKRVVGGKVVCERPCDKERWCVKRWYVCMYACMHACLS